MSSVSRQSTIMSDHCVLFSSLKSCLRAQTRSGSAEFKKKKKVGEIIMIYKQLPFETVFIFREKWLLLASAESFNTVIVGREVCAFVDLFWFSVQILARPALRAINSFLKKAKLHKACQKWQLLSHLLQLKLEFLNQAESSFPHFSLNPLCTSSLCRSPSYCRYTVGINRSLDKHLY